MSSPTSQHKPSPTTNTKPSRLPAPSLFVGPPSRNHSSLSLSNTTSNTAHSAGGSARFPLDRQKSALARPPNPDTGLPDPKALDAAAQGKQEQTQQSPSKASKPSDKEVNGQWREMQSTLADVELTAQSSTHVFGASHAAALDELRRAQVELARAWGRGSDDAAQTEDVKGPDLNTARFQGADDLASERTGRGRSETATSVSTTLSDDSTASRPSGKSQLEEETAQDIRLASERRAANEAYFKKVDRGVKDVVKKLEVVAEAMRGVEGESRSLWSASERSSTDAEGKGAG